MAHEELMNWLPKDIERVAEPGPFLIRDNHGSYSIVALTEVLVTCGGINSKDRAGKIACSLNRFWDRKMKEDTKLWQKMLKERDS